MSNDSVSGHQQGAPSRVRTFAAVFGISVCTVVAYANSLRAPFVFDDGPAILSNASIRELWPIWNLLSPPSGTTLSGRPIANITFAVNYAMGAADPLGYHVFDLAIHILAGLALFGLVRRTLMLPILSERFGRDAYPLAFAVALLWVLHPLNTEAVTYIVQRVESLMGLFYLLTIYCFIRSVESPRPVRWQICTVAACLLGMATKEVMATAPLMALLFDRTFVAGNFRDAWHRRGRLYLCLAATWVPLGMLVAGTHWSRHGSAGFTGSVAPVSYWLTQFEAIFRYLWLSVWPRKLVFDYGPYLIGSPGEALSYAFAVAALLALTIAGLLRHPALGFLGAWAFAILAPTSIVPVATQTIAEHRMYLPLAAVITIVVLSIYVLTGTGRIWWVVLASLAVMLAIATARRNLVYGSELKLWGDTVAKRPDNPRAHCSLGFALASMPGELPQAITEYETAIRLHPNYSEAYNDLGIALEGMPGRANDAVHSFEEAVRIRPDFAEAHNNLGMVLGQLGRGAEAIQHFQEALRIRPGYAEAACNLGSVLCAVGRLQDGIQSLEASIRMKPDYARAIFFLGNAFAQSGQIPEAIQRYEEALRIRPDFAEASNNLGMILCRTGRTDEGISYIEAAIREQPDFVQAHFSRGAALMQLGRRQEANAEFERVLELRPEDPTARKMIELIRSQQ
jgi:tetratricopeptide (TPR) repeat protein